MEHLNISIGITSALIQEDWKCGKDTQLRCLGMYITYRAISVISKELTEGITSRELSGSFGISISKLQRLHMLLKSKDLISVSRKPHKICVRTQLLPESDKYFSIPISIALNPTLTLEEKGLLAIIHWQAALARYHGYFTDRSTAVIIQMSVKTLQKYSGLKLENIKSILDHLYSLEYFKLENFNWRGTLKIKLKNECDPEIYKEEFVQKMYKNSTNIEWSVIWGAVIGHMGSSDRSYGEQKTDLKSFAGKILAETLVYIKIVYIKDSIYKHRRVPFIDLANKLAQTSGDIDPDILEKISGIITPEVSMKEKPKEESFDLVKHRYGNSDKRQEDQEIQREVRSKNPHTWTWKHYLRFFKDRYCLKYKVAPMDLYNAKNRALMSKLCKKNEYESKEEWLERKEQLKSQIEFIFTHWDYLQKMLKIKSVTPSVGILYSYNDAIIGLQSVKIDEVEELDLLDSRLGDMDADEEYRKFMDS